MSTTTDHSPQPARGVVLDIEGMTCASCVARVEKRLQKVPGVEAAVNLATESAKVSAPADVDGAALVDAVRSAGYAATVRSDDASRDDEHEHETHHAGGHGGHDHDVEDRPGATTLLTRLVVSAILSAPVLVVSMIPAIHFPGWEWMALVLTIPVVLWGGWPFHRATFQNARHGAMTMDTLITLGTVAALAWSVWATPTGAHVYYEVAAIVTVFLLAGRFIEQRSRRRAGAALRALMELGADEVTRAMADGADGEVIPTSLLRLDDLFLARPGERIAADGVVVSGGAAVDASAMTGESVPVTAAVGDAVTGGTIAVDGRLVIRATAVGADTRLAHMARLVEDAQAAKGRVQRLADRISSVFVPVVIALSIITLVAWLAFGGSIDQALTAAIAVLIIACPCALGLATPVAILVGTGRGAQLGVLVTGPEAIETAGRIDTVVLDKTGTVTSGRMSVSGVAVADGADRDEVLRMAGALETGSQHPLAAAVVAEAGRGLPSVDGFRSHSGRGVTGTVSGSDAFAGSLALAHELGADVPDVVADAAANATGTVVVVGWVERGESLAARGVIEVSDTVRDDSAAAIAELHGLGLDVVLLTGDAERVARKVAGEVGIDRVSAGATPEDKIVEVRRLREAGHRVAMVGDGVNDSAALAAADLGIAMGGGTDAARHASDVTLVRESLTAVADAVRLSRRMMSIIRGNLFWAFGYNVAAIPLAALGLLNPMIAGAAMAFSSVFVVLNSLRLRRFQR
ncbi:MULTISPECIES: heavy metal translocating P-type ATPase [unclassified Microbacterium]|uniref:heavy metal translocating P-type ATPase n=1 Tax=unclassified Microbacterium TaxID=2609290 RepID=UPI00097F13BB|nr:cation-translocating P-type ATPase [Microbacterium sp. JB110]RCS58993.1 copper-translocating P-type ATPase [Microbacterium sp. JB110]SJM68090.1 Lead, cadmium, zinc and mercury transporting ATPase; Copper-translocating P-type ATPase [Frigoribacterium sp. JB110]